MLLQNLELSSVDAALPFVCYHGKQDLSCGCMPAKSWKSCLKHGEYSWNDSDPLIAGIWDSISQIKVMSKRSKLEKNYSTTHPAESEEDKAAVAAVNRIHGLHVERQPRSSSVATELLENENDNDGSTSNSCEICGDVGNILEMLLCDNCEKAFHVLCCNPKIKALPIDEWFCQPCSKRTDKVSLEDAFRKSHGIGQSNRITKAGSDQIKSTSIHSDQYTSRVGIGKSHQAEVPDWSAQNSQVFDDIGEPEEMDPAVTFNSKASKSFSMCTRFC
uniref:Uncharacterized protein LOC105113992 isoform X1 n=1 Tax=Rhizophora mucronata TaxID=61149 RepID=A0A2P2JXH6_RHIMU